MSIRQVVRWCTAVIAFALAWPAGAAGATVSFNGNVLVFQAAPGEDNALMITRSHADYECGELMPACLVLSESVVPITSFPAGRCMRQTEREETIECAIPESVIANLGDRDDSMWDWDGPSVINAGDGNDPAISGLGGNDRLNGDAGDDNLAGDGGDDVLDGGAGDDSFEGTDGSGPRSGGADTYIGGPGRDLVDYAGRTDDLTVTLDGAGADGAAGEGDDVGADVERVHAGAGDDALAGNAARNELDGRDGADDVRGGAAEDHLLGGPGDDRVLGQDGQDIAVGGDGDDEVDGGAAADELYGDQPFCVPSDCPTGADRILARDGAPDRVRCGAGEDLAVLDPDDTVFQSEQVDRCERVDVAAGGSSQPCGTCDPSGQPGCTTCAPPPASACSTCAPPPPAPCCPAADSVRPAIRDLRARPMRGRRGTTIRFALSKAATVTLRIERRLRDRYVRLPGRLTHSGREGANTLRFGGRIGGRRLKPGRYRLVATARDAAGHVSARAHAALIVRR